MKLNKLMFHLVGTVLFATSVHAAETPSARVWQSDVVENYLKQGNTVNVLTDLENDSRWYGTYRVKSGFMNEDDFNKAFLQLNLRVRGKTYISDKVGIIGDFWLKGTEVYAKRDGVTVDDFDDFDDKVAWEQYRFGLEHDDFGSLMYGKHSATWTLFTMDVGSQGLLDTQGDAAQKSAGKIMYKNHLDNNLFLAGSYDTDSHIYGADVGYQTADLYAFQPNAFGIYASVHNGQPSVMVGNKAIVGNVNINSSNTDNSDTGYARADTDLKTWALAGYKWFDDDYRISGQMAWSERDPDESVEDIRARGWAEGGLGYSANLAVQTIPDNFSGFSYILYGSYDEIGGTSMTPQLEYWFGSPGLRAWISWTWEEKSDDITRIEFQWDF